MRWALLAFVLLFLLAGCTDDDKVARSLQESLPADVTVVEDSCSPTTGKTASGYDHWICLLHYPETALTDDMYRRWDVAVDEDGRVVASSPRG